MNGLEVDGQLHFLATRAKYHEHTLRGRVLNKTHPWELWIEVKLLATSQPGPSLS
jgi:hypothetical protein